MPAPATADELLDLIQKSGVVDEAKLRAYVQKLGESSGPPRDPAKFAGALVRDGILTYFQAEQLLQGKYKRFTIGKYKVLEKLGAGGMAQVFLCEHKLMRRRVAIKVLPTAKADDPSSLERFYREARAVAAVDHPNIVRAYDIDQDENLHFLVMEYVDGTNLQDLVKKIGPLDVTRACHYIYGAAVGLQHAHEIGLVHRDIKPGNILIDRAGVVKILDMGLARFFHDEDDVLTKKYDEHVLGTADYLAPEQALESHTVDIRADIYSLGATFYYLLTGSALFPEGSVAQKLIWHQNRPPRAVKSLRPDVPDELLAVIDRMLAKDPAKRYQTPAEVITALSHWVTTPIPPPSDREMPQVSPAAGGGGRGPTSMVGPAPAAAPAPVGVFARANGQGSSVGQGAAPGPAVAPPPPQPVGTAAPAATQVVAPAPSPAPAANPAVWESLDSDTQRVAREDTARAIPQSEPSPRPAAPTPGGKRTIYAALGLLLLAGAAAGVYFALFNKPRTADPGGPQSGARTLTVNKSGGGEYTYQSLAQALSAAGPGDTIAIAEHRLAESTLRLSPKRHKDIKIKGQTPDGKVPVIEFTGGGGLLFDTTNVEGVHLSGLEFDGKGHADPVVQVSGTCPGLTLENVTIRGATKSKGNDSYKGVHLRVQNAAGESNRPIVLEQLRVVANDPGELGVLVLATANLDNKHVTIRRSRFEGPTRPGAGGFTAIRIDGVTVDVEITENRFLGADAAVSFAKVPANRVIQGKFAHNTAFQCRSGLTFDTAGNEPKGKFDLVVAQNYFGNTNEVAKTNNPGAQPPGLVPADNAQGPGSNPGNVPLGLSRLDRPPLPKPDPNDDATFLRFPGGQPELAPGKPRVGAP